MSEVMNGNCLVLDSSGILCPNCPGTEDCPENKPAALPNRIIEWGGFASQVHRHIRDYAIPQYGDVPDDQCSSWTPRQMMDQIEKYARRFGRGARGREEELRDLRKIAHYACMIHARISEGNEP